MRNPAGIGENAISGDSKDQSGSGEDGNCGVEPKCYDTDDVHEYMSALTKDHGIEWYKWLLRAELEECVRVRLEDNQRLSTLSRS